MAVFDIVALGECLIDFTPLAVAPGQLPHYSQNPGGAPANLVVAAQKVGARTAFLGKMGDDQFGHFLKKTLERHGVNTHGVRLSKEYLTSLAFVSLDEDGQRSFAFYRNPGADQMLREQEVDFSLLEQARVLHISSLAYCGDVISQTADAAGTWAKAHGKLITYDANWRPMLWKDQVFGKEQLKRGLAFADIVKASEDELCYLTGIQDEQQAAESLLDRGISTLVVTKGAHGSSIYTERFHFDVPAFNVHAVDTTSAGDAYFGTFIYQLLQCGDVGGISREQMQNCARVSSAYAAISTTRLGGIPSLPTKEETLAFMQSNEVGDNIC